jgi:hypothetical protein
LKFGTIVDQALLTRTPATYKKTAVSFRRGKLLFSVSSWSDLGGFYYGETEI